jgi:hypothetical protein
MPDRGTTIAHLLDHHTAYVAYDQFAGNPEPTVMKWGFILVTLYMGTDHEPTANNNVEQQGGGGLMLVLNVQ